MSTPIPSTPPSLATQRTETGFRRPLYWALTLSMLGTFVATAIVLAAIALALSGATWLVGHYLDQIPQAWLDSPGNWWQSTILTTLLITVSLSAIVATLSLVAVRRYRPARRWRPALQGCAAALLVALTGPLWWGPVPSLLDAVTGFGQHEATRHTKDYVHEHGFDSLRDGTKWVKNQSENLTR